jgi:hypothetical protein
VQFVHREPLDDTQVRKAVLALLNLDAATRADILSPLRPKPFAD